MNLARLRKGEWLAAGSAVALVVLLFLDWAKPETTVLRDPGAEVPGPLEGLARSAVDLYVGRYTETGYGTLGWPIVVLLLLLVLGALAIAFLTATDAPIATPITVTHWTIVLGIVTTLVLLVRLTLAQPTLGLGFDDAQVDVLAPAWLGLLATAGTTAGAWLALGDERLETFAPPEVPVRPAPVG